jgi:hypothetical protein
MPGPASGHETARGRSFREAIASWRLALRTEVKKSSSLPTAMFDACDPMLETRLAETAETLLARLQEPSDALANGHGAAGEQRLEVVGAHELSTLPQRLVAGAEAAGDLQDGLTAEYLGILADTCCTGTGSLRRCALARLQQDFGVAPEADLQQLAQLLDGQARQVLAAPPCGAGDADADLAALCCRIAAAMAAQVQDATAAAEPDA